MSYGAQLKFGIARQTAFGTPVTLPTSYHGFPLTTEDVGLEKDVLDSQNLNGRFARGAVYPGISKIAGTLDFELTPRNLLAALAAAVNWSPTNVSSGALATMTFLPNTVDYDATGVKAPWSVYKQFSDSNSAEQFYDCQFGQLALTITQGQLVKGKLTANGGARTATGVGSMNVMPDANDISILFPWNVSSVSYGATPLSSLSEITVTLNENIEALYTINGTLAPFKYGRSSFSEVTVEGTFYMNSRSLFNDFVTDTQRRLLIYLSNTRTAIQSGYYNSLTIDIPQLKLTAVKPGANGPGELQVRFTGEGMLDATSLYSIQFTTITTYQAGF